MISDRRRNQGLWKNSIAPAVFPIRDPVADDRAKARSMLGWDVEIESYGLKCSIPCDPNLPVRVKVSNFIRSELYEIKTYMNPSCISICMKLIRKRSYIGAELSIFTFTTDEFTGIHILLRNQKPSFINYKLCMSNRVSFQKSSCNTCCQEPKHKSLILIGSQNLCFDAFDRLYLGFQKKSRYTIVIYGKIQSYRNRKIQG